MGVWVRFPIEPSGFSPQRSPRSFADSGEESMARAAERYLQRQASVGVIGVPPVDPADGPRNRSETAKAVPRRAASPSTIEDALRGASSLGMKRKEAEAVLRRVPRPWPDDAGELVGLLLRHR